MEQRTLGHSGLSVSVIGLGTWQLGSDWGDVSEQDAYAVLEAAYEEGIRFFDTADVYGDGRSERLIGNFLRSNSITDVVVATKAGRRVAQVPANYTLANLRKWTDRSRKNLGVDRLQLVQLHCPPSPVYESERVFDALDVLVNEGLIENYGVSVEKRSEALAAIDRPGVTSVQIILNMLRLGPLGEVLPAAVAADVGIIARVPLASGLLSGRYDQTTTFAENDHRNYNRKGEAFDVGETFSGVDFNVGLEAVDRLSRLTPEGATLAQFALRWIIDQPGVSTVIPGARNKKQARLNARAADLDPLTEEQFERVAQIYADLIEPQVGDRW